MGRKSRYYTVSCNYNIAKGCRRVANAKTMREPNMCMPCWQSMNSARLNAVRNRRSIRGLKKILMRLPVTMWDVYEKKFYGKIYDECKNNEVSEANGF